MRWLIAFVSWACLAVPGCGGQSVPRYQIQTLASGKSVKVLGVGKINLPQGGPALMLKYVSEVSLDDRAALSKEADGIWDGFRAEAEKANVESAILSANSPPTGGFIQQGKAFDFVYERDSSGVWRRLADKK